jgi:hypothetical protein
MPRLKIRTRHNGLKSEQKHSASPVRVFVDPEHFGHKIQEVLRASLRKLENGDLIIVQEDEREEPQRALVLIERVYTDLYRNHAGLEVVAWAEGEPWWDALVIDIGEPCPYPGVELIIMQPGASFETGSRPDQLTQTVKWDGQAIQIADDRALPARSDINAAKLL